MLSRLVFASQNQGKIAEVRAWLAPFGIVVSSVADFAATKDLSIAETATTFSGNARIKAEGYGNILQLPVLADDSGLEVTALGGEPGVASNRWFPGADSDRNQALLQRLVDKTDRSARFVTVLCYYNPANSQVEFFEGEVLGKIALSPTGTAGFGYDPIFLPAGQTQSFGEIGVEIKNTMSHRAKALEKFVALLSSGRL